MSNRKPAAATGNGSSALSGGTLEGAAERLAEVVKPVGAYRTLDHRYYWNGRGPLTSVTTALDVIHREALQQHKQREAVAAMFHAFDNGWVDDPTYEDEWIAWAKAQPQLAFEDAGKRGTLVHLIAEMMGSDGSLPTGFEIAPWQIPYANAWKAFRSWLSASQGQILSSEHQVYNLADGYAGTYDLIFELNDQVWLADVKTSKGYYPEYGLQLAAYGRAQFVGLEGDPTQYALPHIDRYAVVHLRPELYRDGWALVEYPITGRDYIAFLACLDLYQWQGERRFTHSILKRHLEEGDLTKIGTDPLTKE